jgi:hypothetical protein
MGILFAYGPDNNVATKLVASVLAEPGGEIVALDRWIVEGGDIREVPSIQEEVAAFYKRHRVRKTHAQETIAGCPHEEGKDYPMRRECPHCSFWQGINRFSYEPIIEPPATRSVEQVIEELSETRDLQPLLALESADAHREALTVPLLSALEKGIADPAGTPEGDATLFTYALYLFAKWRETRAYPLVLHWLSLPGEGAFDIAGDIVTQDGARILAAVCDGDLEPIKQLVMDRDANESGRGAAVDALGLLGVWAEVPKRSVDEYLLGLAKEGLERTGGYLWGALASACVDTEVIEAISHLRKAYEEGLIDPDFISIDELDEVERGPRGKWIEREQNLRPPITDIAEATRWWANFGKSEVERQATDTLFEKMESEDVILPNIPPPKVGRNSPCPCGSGKKFKKCCGN